MSETVRTDIRDGVAVITLDRPEALNALNPEMARALRESVESAAALPGVRCLVLRGAGEHFMAGGDVLFFRHRLESRGPGEPAVSPDVFRDAHGVVRALRAAPQPVIASVRGAAAGYGVSLVAACDLAVAAEGSVFTLAYCHIGATPDGGATYFLPRTVGLKRTMEMMLLGDRYDAREALSMGLVNRVVPPGNLDRETERLAARLASGPAEAYARGKALVNASLASTLEDQLVAEEGAFVRISATLDFAEGVRAFCEKRAARFRG